MDAAPGRRHPVLRLLPVLAVALADPSRAITLRAIAEHELDFALAFAYRALLGRLEAALAVGSLVVPAHAVLQLLCVDVIDSPT